MLQHLFISSAILACCTVGIAVADSPTTMPSVASPDAASTMPSTGPATAPVAITWDQAKDHIGETAVVTGPVAGTHDFGGAAVLNLGKDFPDKTRFSVFIPADKRKGMPDDLDEGQTISVTGTLKMFHGGPEVEADPAHITIVGPGPTTAASQP